MLWHQALARLGEGLGRFCETGTASGEIELALAGKAVLAPAMTATLTVVCAWSPDLPSQTALSTRLWETVMGFSVAGERDAFAAFFVGNPETAALTPRQRVETMVLAMTLNPHFLLAK
jgi:hypothetical protein